MGGVLVVELLILPCLLVVFALAVGAILVASRHPAPAVGRVVGVRGVVTSVIPLGGFGEIRVRVGEQSLRLRARSGESLALGTEVVVAAELDESTVLVRPQPPRLPR